LIEKNWKKRLPRVILVNVSVISLILGLYLLRYYRHINQQNNVHPLPTDEDPM